MGVVGTITEISGVKGPFGHEVELILCLCLFQLQCFT